MKHNIKITAIILGMFLITQFIGLYVVKYYQPEEKKLPLGMETPKIEKKSEYYWFFVVILIAFIIAISLLFFLTKFNVKFLLRLWFFAVVVIALTISFNSFLSITLIALLAALPLAFIKIYKRGFLVHNITEMFVYPGIAAVFVPLMNVLTIIALLVIISAYDIWAVWHSGIMQKMAKYQISKLKIFSGFFVPYVSKKIKMQLRNMKKSELKRKKIKINVAILGGGDIIFPTITAGVMLKTLGLISALFVIAGATLGLAYLLFFSEKKKFYPAMPFITAGIFVGIVLGYVLG